MNGFATPLRANYRSMNCLGLPRTTLEGESLVSEPSSKTHPWPGVMLRVKNRLGVVLGTTYGLRKPSGVGSYRIPPLGRRSSFRNAACDIRDGPAWRPYFCGDRSLEFRFQAPKLCSQISLALSQAAGRHLESDRCPVVGRESTFANDFLTTNSIVGTKP